VFAGEFGLQVLAAALARKYKDKELDALVRACRDPRAVLAGAGDAFDVAALRLIDRHIGRCDGGNADYVVNEPDALFGDNGGPELEGSSATFQFREFADLAPELAILSALSGDKLMDRTYIQRGRAAKNFTFEGEPRDVRAGHPLFAMLALLAPRLFPKLRVVKDLQDAAACRGFWSSPSETRPDAARPDAALVAGNTAACGPGGGLDRLLQPATGWYLQHAGLCVIFVLDNSRTGHAVPIFRCAATERMMVWNSSRTAMACEVPDQWLDVIADASPGHKLPMCQKDAKWFKADDALRTLIPQASLVSQYGLYVSYALYVSDELIDEGAAALAALQARLRAADK
jgi:hypothetical protein